MNSNNIENTPTINVKKAVDVIKSAILQSQSRAVKMISGTQLSLYFGVGLYVSANSRKGTWGTNAIKFISEQLKRELPGLRGFSEESIKKMRTFSEFWSPFLNRSPMATEMDLDKLQADIECDRFSLTKWSPMATEINRDEFLGLSFSHHMEILHKTKNIDEVLLCIHEAVTHQWDKYTLRNILKAGIPKPDGVAPNNFIQTMPSTQQAMKAIKMFKDEYLLDYINVEDIDAQEKDVDERLVEQRIIHNIKRFIMTLGRDFTFVGNQYHLEKFGKDHFVDLLFYNRELMCLVAVELKLGEFKPIYLGQLQTYLQILDDEVRKPNENPSIGIVLCQDMDKSYVEYVIQRYDSPMGVAKYHTSVDMPDELRKALPDIDSLKRLLSESNNV